MVGLVFGPHFELRCRDRHADDEVVAAGRLAQEPEEEVVEGVADAALPAAADVVQQLVHEDQRRPRREHRLEGITSRSLPGLVMPADRLVARLTAELPGDLPPRGLPRRLPFPASAVEQVKLRAHKHRHGGLRHFLDPGPRYDLIDPLPGRGCRPAAGKMVEGSQRVGLAAAELGRHVEIGARLHRLAGQPAHDLRRKFEEATGEIGAVEESGRIEVIGRHAPPLLANMVEVDRKLGRIERPVLAEILAGGDNLIPGLWCGSSHPIHPSVVTRSDGVNSLPLREHQAWRPSDAA